MFVDLNETVMRHVRAQ